MDHQVHTWFSFFMSWLPFIILIGFWLYFMRTMGVGGRHARYIERSHAFMDRQEQLLERIAVALEERNRTRRTE